MASDPKGLLDNPNAPSQNNPMHPTTAGNPKVTGAAAAGPGMQGQSAAVGSGQQVVPNTPGDRALLSPLPGQGGQGADFGQQVADYEQALGYDPNTMSVQGRVTDMMSNPDNPLLRQARNNANLQMAGRGLRNSSIALQAGEEAAYNAALPIATADAQIAMENRRAAFGAAIEDQQMQKQHGYDLEKIDKEYQNNRGLADQQFSFNKELQSREFGHEETLQERGFGHEETLQERGFEHEIGLQERGQEHDWRMQASQFQHEVARAEQEFGYSKHLQAIDLATRERIAALDRQTNERIADKDIAARQREANAQREWARAERESEQIWKAEQNFAQNEWQAGQANLEMAWKSAESGAERDSLWERAVYELDRQAEQGGLDRASRERIAELQNSGNRNISALGAIADIMGSARTAEGAAASGGGKNAGKYIDQIRRNAQNDIDTMLRLWEQSGPGQPGHYGG